MANIQIEYTENAANIHLTPEGRNYLASNGEITGKEPSDNVIWRLPFDIMWSDLFEDHNGELDAELLNPDRDYRAIGALTSAPIFAQDVERDGRDEIVGTGAVYWFPDYQVSDELAELLFNGVVTFSKAEDM